MIDSVFGGGLFSTKKLVIVHGLPLDTDVDNKITAEQTNGFIDTFLAREGNVSPDVLLIFVSYKPDKRSRLYKFLKDKAQIKTFGSLKWIQYKIFVKEQLGDMVAADDVLDQIVLKVGYDLYRLESETKKLILRCQANSCKKLDQKIVDNVVYGQVEINSFLFFDNFLTNKRATWRILEKMQQSGADIYQTAGMLYRGLKLYLFLLDLWEQWIQDSKMIAQKIKYHPFAVSKNLKNISSIKNKEWEIKAFYKELVFLDYDIKIGKFPSEWFWLELKKMIYKF